MDRVASQAMTSEIPLFRDGLGERFLLTDNDGRGVRESLLLRTELAAVPAFEYALSLRIKELETFQHPSFVRVQTLVRTSSRLPRLSLLSDYVPGRRLSELLTPGADGAWHPNAAAALECPGAGSPPSLPSALFLIREILDAVALLHRQAATTTHGVLGPERVIIADARPRIAECVLGSAIEQLRFSHDRYWNDLRVAVPPAAGQARFDRRTDVAQVGMLALALFAGRLLKDEEHLGNVLGLVDALTEHSEGTRAPLPQPLRSWLLKMLQLDVRRSYVSAGEAQHALEQATAEAGVKPSGAELEGLTRPSRRAAVPGGPQHPAPSPALRQAQGVPSSSMVRRCSPSTLSLPNGSRDGGSAQETERVPTPSQLGTKKVAPRAVSAAKPPRQAVLPSRREYLDRLERRGSWGRFFLQIFIIVGLTAGAFAVARIVPPPGTWFPRTGTIVVDSKPQGATILIDGEERGVTPATITIEAGRHKMELRARGRARTVEVMVPAGGKIVETVELRPTAQLRRPAATP